MNSFYLKLNFNFIRFYSDNKGNVTVKMAHATMEYSFEYLGNGQKLVRTPLTDRCFLTLTQVCFFNLTIHR